MTVDSPSPVFFQLRWSMKNLRLRSGRTLLTAAGVSLAVALLVSIAGFHRGYREALRRSIEQLGFEVLVTAKGCPYEAATLFLRGGNIPMYLDESACDEVIGDPAVESSTRLFLQTRLLEEGAHQVYLGVDEDYRRMKPWLTLQMGEWFHNRDAGEAMLGYNVATALKKTPGDHLEIPGTAHRLRVVGILDRCGAQDDGTIFLPLRVAQKVFDQKDRLTGLGIKLRDPGLLPDYLTRLYALPGVQAIPLSQAQGAILNFVGSARALLTAVGVLTAVVAGLALGNSVLMSLLERRRELAILRALGARGAYLFGSVVIEAALVCFLGGLAGILLAVAAGSVLESCLRDLVPFSPEGTLLQLQPGTAVAAIGMTLIVGVACCLVPAWQATRVKPVPVLRQSE